MEFPVQIMRKGETEGIFRRRGGELGVIEEEGIVLCKVVSS